MQVGLDELLKEVFRPIVGDHQSTSKVFKLLAERSHGLDLKLCPNDSSLASLILGLLVEEAGVKAVNRKDFFVSHCRLFECPVEDGVVVNAEVVSEPQDYSVHFLFVEVLLACVLLCVVNLN